MKPFKYAILGLIASASLVHAQPHSVAAIDLSNVPNTTFAAKALAAGVGSQTVNLSGYVLQSALSPVATSGRYGDLSGLPALGTASTHAATDFALSSSLSAFESSLGSAAYQPTSAFDVAGAAQSASNASVPRTGYASPLAIVANMTAAQTGDFGGLTFQTQTGISADYLFNGGATGSNHNSDAIRGVNVLTPGSTVVNTNGIAGYVLDNAPAAGNGTNAVAIYGVGWANVNGAHVWGTNPVLSDQLGTATGTATGRELLNEYDYNVFNTGTLVYGSQQTANFLVAPLGSDAYNCTGDGSSYPWGYCYYSSDGYATNALYVGALARTGSSVNGQLILLGWRDSSGAMQTDTLQMGSSGILNLSTSGNGGYAGLFVAGDITASRNISAGVLNLTSSSTTTTAPAAGGAGTLPATPKGYLAVTINTRVSQIPYY